MSILVYYNQCKKYRSQFTEDKKAVYEEKLEASEIFKDKKALYPSRLAVSFTMRSPSTPSHVHQTHLFYTRVIHVL